MVVDKLVGTCIITAMEFNSHFFFVFFVIVTSIMAKLSRQQRCENALQNSSLTFAIYFCLIVCLVQCLFLFSFCQSFDAFFLAVDKYSLSTLSFSHIPSYFAWESSWWSCRLLSRFVKKTFEPPFSGIIIIICSLVSGNETIERFTIHWRPLQCYNQVDESTMEATVHLVSIFTS